MSVHIEVILLLDPKKTKPTKKQQHIIIIYTNFPTEVDLTKEEKYGMIMKRLLFGDTLLCTI